MQQRGFGVIETSGCSIWCLGLLIYVAEYPVKETGHRAIVDVGATLEPVVAAGSTVETDHPAIVAVGPAIYAGHPSVARLMVQ